MTKKVFLFSKRVLIILLSVICFVSCSKEEEVEISLSDQVVGMYVGTGKLATYGVTIETWSGMKVYVTKSSSDYALVRLEDAAGDEILENDVFQILKTSSGDYVLNSQENPLSKINIKKDGSIEYNNDGISVNGESGYSISFTGKRETR